jgi:hypothetical protein
LASQEGLSSMEFVSSYVRLPLVRIGLHSPPSRGGGVFCDIVTSVRPSRVIMCRSVSQSNKHIVTKSGVDNCSNFQLDFLMASLLIK